MIAVGILLLLLDIFLQYYFRLSGDGVLNKGVSFGLISGYGPVVALVAYLSLVIVLGYLVIRRINIVNNGIWLILLGGLGNLAPRIFLGGVWDYLQVPLLPFWFNISDIMITVGVVSYLLAGGYTKE